MSTWYQLSVGNVGLVGCGADREIAIQQYHKYVELSKLESGRVSGKSVILFESTPESVRPDVIAERDRRTRRTPE